ncbi:MAG: helix-turn-helix transcriptional regulator [Bacteroidia bacterium]|nr:helix-turn-helix transcriptional regulator [Bacteroidia bacterium]
MKDIAFDKLIETIVDRRKKSGKTQKQTAEILGVSIRTYAYYEKQSVEIPAKHLLRLCTLFNIDVNSFLDSGEIKDHYSQDEIARMTNRLDNMERAMLEGFKHLESKIDSSKQLGTSHQKPELDGQEETQQDSEE